MITEPAKVFLPLTGLGLAAAVFYAMTTGDHAGAALFLGLATVAFSGGIIITTQRDNELAPVVAADAAPPARRPIGAVRLPGGPGWPAMAAAGVGFGVVALVTSPLFGIASVTLLIVAAAGWLASVSVDRTGRAPDLMPFGIPIVGLFAIGALMFLLSRVLLAVPEQASTAIALLVAVLIMGAASFVAVKPQVSGRTLLNVLLVAGVVMTGGGVVAAIAGEREIEEHHAGHEAVEIEADNIQFNVAELHFAPDSEAILEFKNNEPVPHNVAIYANPEFSGLAIFQGAVITADSIEYRFRAPAPGTYYFRCDIHPLMQGKVTVG
ncbi:MAG TPA: cupredoxin domain-containing protein [Acidimicrobiales bacterium]